MERLASVRFALKYFVHYQKDIYSSRFLFKLFACIILNISEINISIINDNNNSNNKIESAL